MAKLMEVFAGRPLAILWMVVAAFVGGAALANWLRHKVVHRG